jgi:hypothetical protein
MRRALLAGMVAAAFTSFIAATLIGCPAAHDSYPSKSCNPSHGNTDCYLGEICNPASMMCEVPPPDMSMSLDFPKPDFSENPDLFGEDLGGGDL